MVMAKDIALRLYRDADLHAEVDGDRMLTTDAYGWNFKVGDILHVQGIPYVITSVEAEDDMRWDPAPYRLATARRVY